MYSTRTRETRAHSQRTSSRGTARVGQKSADFIGTADFRARAGMPRRLPREDRRAEVGEEVRVGVGVRVGPVEFKLNQRHRQWVVSGLILSGHACFAAR